MKINNIQTYTNISTIQERRKREINKKCQNDFSYSCDRNKNVSFSGLFSLKTKPLNAKLATKDIQMVPGTEYLINDDCVFESCGYKMDLKCDKFKNIIKELKPRESFIIGRDAVFLPNMPNQISRRHIQISKLPNGSLVAQDLNSKNGTKITQNIKEIPLNVERQELEPGKYHLLPYNAIICAYNTPLFLQDYKDRITSLEEGKELIVGRSSNCDIQLNNEYISGRHLAIRPYNGFALVKDLHSTNGTSFLRCENERAPRPITDCPNDLLYITDTTELQKGVRTRIPNDCQIYLGKHFTIDVRNPNILEVLDKKGKIKIGRSSHCDLIVDQFYSHVSREHLQLEKRGNDIIATDLNSKMSTQVIPKNKIRAFNGGVANIELGQQNIGDCYLLSSIYALSMTTRGQQCLEDMVSVDDNGNYIVDFYDSYQPIKVKPEELDGQKSLKEEKRNVSGDLGIRAIERAYGKLVRGFGGENRTLYMQIDDGGFPDIALKKMTGIRSKREAIRDGQTQRKLEEIYFSGLENYVLTCSTPKSHYRNGYVDEQRRFNETHAYGIKSINPYNQTIEIVNPHNTMKTEVIGWNEFTKYFDYIYIGDFRNKIPF